MRNELHKPVTHWTLLPVLVLLASIPFQSSFAQYCGKRTSAKMLTGSYLNARFGYALGYDAGWHRLHVGADERSFQLVCRDTVVVSANVLDVVRDRHFNSTDFDADLFRSGKATRSDSLRRAIAFQASLFCGADGVDGSRHCEASDTFVASFTPSRVPVLTFYQTLVVEDYTDDSTTRSQLGPYHAIDISQPGVDRLLLINAGHEREAMEAYKEIVDAVVNSVRLVESVHFKR